MLAATCSHFTCLVMRVAIWFGCGSYHSAHWPTERNKRFAVIDLKTMGLFLWTLTSKCRCWKVINPRVSLLNIMFVASSAMYALTFCRLHIFFFFFWCALFDETCVIVVCNFVPYLMDCFCIFCFSRQRAFFLFFFRALHVFLCVCYSALLWLLLLILLLVCCFGALLGLCKAGIAPPNLSVIATSRSN